MKIHNYLTIIYRVKNYFTMLLSARNISLIGKKICVQCNSYNSQISSFESTCDKCKIQIAKMSGYNICTVCKAKFPMHHVHCCNCDITYNISEKKHCCKCKVIYDYDEIHCCNCGMNIFFLNKKHCCECKKIIKENILHCCKCKFTCEYNIFEYTHCCNCRILYKLNEKHCCKCKKYFSKNSVHNCS